MSNIYKNRKLRTKIFLLLFVIVIIIVSFIGVFSFYISYNYAIINEAEKQILILENIQQDTNQVIQNLHYAGISISCDKRVISVLSALNKMSYEEANYDIQKAFYNQAILENTSDVCVIGQNGSMFTSIKEQDVVQDLYNQYHSKFNDLERTVMGFWGRPVIRQNGSAVLPYFRRIKDYASHEYLGAVVVCMNEKNISDTYKSVTKNDMIVLMLDDKENIVVSSNDKYINKLFSELADVTEHDDNKEYFKSMIGENEYFCVQSTDTFSGYTYIALMPMDIVMTTPNSILSISIIVLIIAFILAVLVSLIFSNTIAKPIASLVRVMDKTHNMQEIHSLHYKNNDEIGKLIKSFLSMSERLNNSLSNVLEEQEKRRLAEFNALKWQINPHFLYNTLSSIVWLSKNQEHTKVIEVTKALTTLLKIGLSKDKELITIKDEMEHVKSYLEIQILRYKDQFKYIFDIEPDCLKLYTVKIITQPLVENAIYHGVRDRNDGGIVKVSCRQQDGIVILDVSDNGDNMTPEHAQELNDFISGKTLGSNEKFGIGIKNVHDRIRYYFKGDYGLEFKRKNSFTIARIKIPVIDRIENVNR